MKYFPLTTDRFEHQFGISALPPSESVIEVTERYDEEIRLRRAALDRDQNYYFRAFTGSLLSQGEVVALICEAAGFINDGVNTKTGEEIDCGSELPLLGIARHVQEDLAIISGDAEKGFPLIAGAIVFPSGWCVGDKMGQSVLGIHEPVPEFQRALNLPTQHLLARLKTHRPAWRTNWGVRPSGQLDQSPIHAAELQRCREGIDQQNAGAECFFRVERQTLSRLPGGDILFTIHTFQSPLDQLPQQQAHNLLGVLKSCPEQTLCYKGIWPMRDALIGYLSERLHSFPG